MKKLKIICIDFDGVLHSYQSGWQGASTIPDAPVDGAINWLQSLLDSETLKPVIYSARSCQEGGIEAMKRWLVHNGLPPKYIELRHFADAKLQGLLEFPTQKPVAWLTIDDRAIVFSGAFPNMGEIANFKSWLD